MYKLKATGFPDLDFYISREDCKNIRVTINYSYANSQNTVVADHRSVTIKISPENKVAEIISFQNKEGVQEIYPGNEPSDEALGYELNARLHIWLNEISSQGYNFERGRKGRIW